MTQQPQGQPQYNNQPYGQQPQGQPQGQQGFAPSAYSAPQPGYGHPNQGGGFGGLFKTDFGSRITSSVASTIMLLALVAFGIFAGYALFDLIAYFVDGPMGLGADASAMGIMTALLNFAFRVAIAFVLLGLTRVTLEYFVAEERKGGAAK